MHTMGDFVGTAAEASSRTRAAALAAEALATAASVSLMSELTSQKLRSCQEGPGAVLLRVMSSKAATRSLWEKNRLSPAIHSSKVVGCLSRFLECSVL